MRLRSVSKAVPAVAMAARAAVAWATEVGKGEGPILTVADLVDSPVQRGQRYTIEYTDEKLHLNGS